MQEVPLHKTHEPEITLLNIDCMQFMATLPDKAFDLAVVDPPYGINYDLMQKQQADSNKISNGGKWKKYKTTNWDKEIPSIKYFKELFRVSQCQIIWGGNYFFLPPCCKWLVWNKIQRSCMSDGEMAWTSMNGQVDIFDMSRADAYINKCDAKIHPTQKPVALYNWILRNYAKPGQRVLDTHLGSGSSAIAAHYFGCDFVGCEIDESYFLAAKERFDRETRQVAMF
jgi:site-specific DNA-methyltransferase (adenine-specific)